MVTGTGNGGNVFLAALGKLASVQMDTTAVNRGDTIVTSSTANQATMDNTQLTTKSGGSPGTVDIIIR